MTVDARYLIDTGVFILYFRRNQQAITFWKKGLEVVTTNPRHFKPIEEISVKRFPEDF